VQNAQKKMEPFCQAVELGRENQKEQGQLDVKYRVESAAPSAPRQKIGYARVSTGEQTLQPQTLALEAAGCNKILTDHGISGAKFIRPGLSEALSLLQHGDMLVVWRLDRLGRSLPHLIAIINDLADRGIEFKSLTESIDTSSSGGRLVFHMMAALAEFERSLISERTRAGMLAARIRGARMGRPPALTADQKKEAVLIIQGGQPLSVVAAHYNVHIRTLRRAIAAQGMDVSQIGGLVQDN
jgi:DNA invertase Pin-like site-specific DNA recombinase